MMKVGCKLQVPGGKVWFVVLDPLKTEGEWESGRIKRLGGGGWKKLNVGCSMFVC
jgi:hypothetical protein